MRLGTKILLLMLLITVGTAGALAWIVTLNVTRYETARAHEKISSAISRYVAQLDDKHRRTQKIVGALLEQRAFRTQLRTAAEGDSFARELLRTETLAQLVQAHLDDEPAFHVLLNAKSELIVAAAPNDPTLETALSAGTIRWPVEPVINTPSTLTSTYVALPSGLFLAMAVPLRSQADGPTAQALFVGFRIDNNWVRTQLVADRLISSDAPLAAWFLVADKVVASASAQRGDPRIAGFSAHTPLKVISRTLLPPSRTLGSFERIEFENAGEHYLGQAFDLVPNDSSAGRLVLASSLDEVLVTLRDLQEQIALFAIATSVAAIVACQWLARRIGQPIQQLVSGTQRIAAGQFDQRVRIPRRDEFGKLADAFNTMSHGLIERDALRDEKTKVQRDLALARKIQMDVLPKQLPPCPGYDLAAYSLPAEQTGGDIYDLVALEADETSSGPSSLVLLLADATGHGVGPALSVTQVRAMLRIGVRLHATLDELLSQINRQLCQDLGAERFVTAFLGVLDPDRHRMSYHSAGQAPILHFVARQKYALWLGSSTLPLGIDDDPPNEGLQELELEAGDLLVLLTDGFYEFRNADGEQFGAQRVGDVVCESHTGTADGVLAELREAIRVFGNGAPQLDDMTALIIKRNEVAQT